MELPDPEIKNFLVFSLKKFFLYFGKWNFLATSLKNSYISGANFKVPSSKKSSYIFLIFLKNKFIIFFLLFLKINLYIFHHNILYQNLYSRNYLIKFLCLY